MNAERTVADRLPDLAAELDAAYAEQAILDRAVRWLAMTLGADACKIVQVVPGSDSCVVRAGVGWAPGVVGTSRVPISAYSVAGYALITSRGPLTVKNVLGSTYFRDANLLREHGYCSALVSPIGRETDRPFGVLSVHMRAQRGFSAAECDLVLDASDLLFSKLEKTQAERAQRMAIAREALHEG